MHEGEARAYRWTAWSVAAVALAVIAAAAVVAVELPYGDWDAMSFGTWSRLIAQHWPHIRFASVDDLSYQRPVFYFLQGTLRSIFGFHQSLGRLLSLGFSVLLVAGVATTAAVTVPRRVRPATAALAAALLLATAPFERYIVAGLSDIPVAAVVAATAAVALTKRLGRARLPLVAAGAFAAVLTKPTALASLAGLALALLVAGRERMSVRVRAPIATAAGIAAALIYDDVQAHMSHVPLQTFLTTGTNGFYATLAAQRRSDVLLDATWLGTDLRLFLVFGLLYGAGRLALGHRPTLVLSIVGAAVWSEIVPRFLNSASVAAAGGGSSSGSVEHVAVVLLGASVFFGLVAPTESIPCRRELIVLLVWLAPPFLVWAVYSVYDVRLLSAAWPPLFLLMARALVPAVAGAATVDARAVAAPALGAAVLAAYGSLQINGLGSSGWHRLQSAAGDPAALRDLAIGGDFSAELTALAPQVRPRSPIVTMDQRLRFFYLDQVEIQTPDSCAQLAGPEREVLVLLESDEERTLYGDKATSDFWLGCRKPSPTLVAERPGAFAVFVNHGAVPEPGACDAAPTPGLAVEFGRFRTVSAADALAARLKELGFVEAKVERVSCDSFRVAYTGIPNAAVGRSVIAEAKKAKLRARLVRAA